MEEQIAALMNVVREEVALYRELIEHARQKTALLVRGPLEAILESNKIDETFNSKLRLLEHEVAKLSQPLCQRLQITLGEFTLLKLADAVEQSLAAEIRSQSTLFKHLIAQLKSVTQRNRRLVESTTSFSQGLLDFISNATSSYQSTGMFKPYSVVSGTISNKA